MAEEQHLSEGKASDTLAEEARIDALAERISDALGRIARTVRMAPVGDGDQAEEVQELEAQLKKERELTEELRQWAERLKQRIRRMSHRYEVRLKRLADRIDAQGAEIRALRESNAELLQQLAALREASAESVPDADRINRAMESEIRAMQAARASEIAEIDSLLEELAPLMKEHGISLPGVGADKDKAGDDAAEGEKWHG